jgi:hypothetical protein
VILKECFTFKEKASLLICKNIRCQLHFLFTSPSPEGVVFNSKDIPVFKILSLSDFWQAPHFPDIIAQGGLQDLEDPGGILERALAKCFEHKLFSETGLVRPSIALAFRIGFS